MSKYRRAARKDNNENEIVKALRAIPGVTVQPNMDDILVGHKGLTYWIELKNPETVSSKTGKVRESAIKASQKKLRSEWTGHYKIVSSLEEVLEDIGILNGDRCK